VTDEPSADAPQGPVTCPRCLELILPGQPTEDMPYAKEWRIECHVGCDFVPRPPPGT
jgi:hypothetical protein